MRHQSAHLPRALATAEGARQVTSAGELLREVQAIQAEALDLMALAKADGDVRAAVVALKEMRECIELKVRIGAELLANQPSDPMSIVVEYVRPRQISEDSKS